MDAIIPMLTSKLTLPAPCKINRFLHITGRRPDGYHELQTVFQFLDFSDTLCFSPHHELSLQVDRTDLALHDNLVLRAARLLQEHTGTTQGAKISLSKRIPTGAGLGGGSSDAATTLHALNHLWQTELSTEQLAALGLHLGADVPVFVYGQTAWAEGVGERLTPISMDTPWFLVLKPPVHCATAAIFQHDQLTRNTPISTLTTFRWDRAHNDCEDVVCRMYPEVAQGLNWLRQFGPAFLTGTGSCVVQACQSQDEALKRLAMAPFSGFIAKSCNQSSLLLAMEALGFMGSKN